MGGCAALNCKNHSSKNKIRMFRFPTNAERRKKWIINCQRGDWTPSRHSQICIAHFEESQFEANRADGWKKLKSNAVPTLFNFPNPPQIVMPPCVKGMEILEPECILDESLEPDVYSSSSTDADEAHFTEDQFENRRADNRRLLKQDAVPSVFSHRPPKKSRKLSKNVLLNDSEMNPDVDFPLDEENVDDQVSAVTLEFPADQSEDAQGNVDQDSEEVDEMDVKDTKPETEDDQSKNAEGNLCKIKWKYLRDYYVRRRNKTYQPVLPRTEVEKRRREHLSFLDDVHPHVPREPSVSTAYIKQEPSDLSDEAGTSNSGVDYPQTGKLESVGKLLYSSVVVPVLNINKILESESHQMQETKYCEEDPVTNISTPEIEASDETRGKSDAGDAFAFHMPKRDHIDDFFLSLSTTMRTLPTRLIVEAKNELFQVMSKYELKALEMKKKK